MAKFGDTNTQDTMSGTTILNGTGPPLDALGAVGDYYLDTAAKILYGPKVTASNGPEQIAGSGAPVAADPIGSTTYGTRLRCLIAGRVTALRYYRMGGQAAHTATIVLYQQSNQAELGRTVITNGVGASEGWVQGAIPVPATVAANMDVRVGAILSSPLTSLLPYRSSFLPISAVPATLTINGGCSGNGTPVYPGVDSAAYFYVDIVFQTYTPAWVIALKSAP